MKHCPSLLLYCSCGGEKYTIAISSIKRNKWFIFFGFTPHLSNYSPDDREIRLITGENSKQPVPDMLGRNKAALKGFSI